MNRRLFTTISTSVIAIAGMNLVTALAGTPTYTVQPGDTLYKISVAEHVSLSALEAANPQIQNYNNVQPGTVIQVPTAPSVTGSTSAYVIQPGDTLYKIAVAKGVTLTALIVANPQITNVNNIAIGESLNIPRAAASSAPSMPSITPQPAPPAAPATPSTPAPQPAPATSPTPGPDSSTTAQAIIATAISLIGVHYAWGGSLPSTGFDCSGFVSYVFAQHGISLPRESHDQATIGTPVSQDGLQPGDLLFFANTDSSASLYTNHVTHVGIYLGNGAMIESSSANNNEGVVIVKDVFSNRYYVAHYYGARNVIQ